MDHNFRFYIVYPIPLRDCTLEVNHVGWSALIDSFKDQFEIKTKCREETICGEKHLFMSVYACSDLSRFLIGWIDETVF